jgi:WD40 repeat protein
VRIGGLDIDGLPSVLALPLGEYADEHDPLLRLWHLCDATELTLRLLAALAIADWNRGTEGLPSKLRADLASRIEQPTLGKWRGMVLALTNKAPAATPLPQLYPFVADRFDPMLRGTGTGADGIEDSVLALRNRLAHGGGMSRAMAATLLDAHAHRFEEAIEGLGWLASWRFVAAHGGGVLLGPTTELAPATGDEATAAARSADDRPGAVVAVRDEHALNLWPLLQYGVPGGVGLGGASASMAVPQIYSRRGEVRLVLTPLGSDEVAVAESEPAAVVALEALTARDEPLAIEWAVPGFEAELRRDAAHQVGRSVEIETARAAVSGRDHGVVWMTGTAGIGKSFVLAALAQELAGDDSQVTLAYRFKVGDPRCSRDAFARYAVERLRAQLADPPPSRGQPVRELRALLEARGERRVVFLLDGLEEIAAIDPAFATDVPLGLATHATWLCCGRAERGLGELFGAVESVFPAGLPGLARDDVRAMLLAKIGPLSKRLVRADSDTGVNPFIDRVVANAHGLPIYVAYVIGDVLAGRLTSLDEHASLPPSLEAYHEALLSGCAVGDVHQLLTPLMCTLALGEEPLGAHVVHALLARRGLATPDAFGADMVDRALAGAATMLRRVSREVDGKPVATYALFHTSLRDHLTRAPQAAMAVATARAAFADAALEASHIAEPDTAAYLYDHGISHLCAARRTEQAARLLCDPAYLMARLGPSGGTRGVSGVLADFRVIEHDGARGAVADWHRFVANRAHLVARGGAVALLQAAIADGEHSALTAAFEAWIGAEPPTRPWLRRLDRPLEPLADPCLRTYEGHERAATGFAMLGDGHHAVSCGGDAVLRVWDLRSGEVVRVLAERQETLSFAMVTSMPAAECLRPLEGHGWTVWSVCVLADGRAVAAHGDRTLKVWDLETGEVRATLRGHEGFVWHVAAHPTEPRVLSASDDGTLRLWDVDTGQCLRVLRGHDGWVARVAFLGDGSGAVSAGGDGTIRHWDLTDRFEGRFIGGHRGYAAAIAVSADGTSAYSGGEDGSIVHWDLGEARMVRKWQAHAAGVWSLAVTSEGVLSGGRDGVACLWDPERGERTRVLRGHAGWIWQVADAGKGRAMTASSDRTLKSWDLDAAAAAQGRAAHEGSVVALAMCGEERAVTAGSEGTFKLWDVASGRCVRTLYEDAAAARLVGLDDDAWMSVAPDGTARVWSVDGVEQRRFAGPAAARVAAACAALVAAGADGVVTLWDVSTGTRVAELGAHRAGALSVAVSADGLLAATGGADGVIELWDLRRRSRLRSLRGHTWDVQALAFGSAGKLVSASRDRTVMVWDLGTGRCEATLPRHGGDHGALAVWPGGDHVLSAADGKTVALFAPAEDRTVVSWPADAEVTAIAISRGGRIVLGDVAGRVTTLAVRGSL